MTGPVATRLALGHRVAAGYLRNPKVDAVLIAGSVARGIADDFSDLELDICWSAPPDETERRAPIEAVNAEIRAIHPYEDNEWAETFLVAGIKVDTSMFLAETVARRDLVFLSDVVGQATRAEPAAAVRELRLLLVETLQLVERHLPEVDTAPGWAAVAGDQARVTRPQPWGA